MATPEQQEPVNVTTTHEEALDAGYMGAVYDDTDYTVKAAVAAAESAAKSAASSSGSSKTSSSSGTSKSS